MKSQSLPITTIALIIIAVLALVVVIIFFLGGFDEIRSPTESIIDIGGDRLTVSECVAQGKCLHRSMGRCLPEGADNCGSCIDGVCDP